MQTDVYKGKRKEVRIGYIGTSEDFKKFTNRIYFKVFWQATAITFPKFQFLYKRNGDKQLIAGNTTYYHIENSRDFLGVKYDYLVIGDFKRFRFACSLDKKGKIKDIPRVELSNIEYEIGKDSIYLKLEDSQNRIEPLEVFKDYKNEELSKLNSMIRGIDPEFKKCSTYQVSTGKHCPRKANYSVDGYKVCRRCYESILLHKKENDARR